MKTASDALHKVNNLTNQGFGDFTSCSPCKRLIRQVKKTCVWNGIAYWLDDCFICWKRKLQAVLVQLRVVLQERNKWNAVFVLPSYSYSFGRSLPTRCDVSLVIRFHSLNIAQDFGVAFVVATSTILFPSKNQSVCSIRLFCVAERLKGRGDIYANGAVAQDGCCFCSLLTSLHIVWCWKCQLDWWVSSFTCCRDIGIRANPTTQTGIFHSCSLSELRCNDISIRAIEQHRLALFTVVHWARSVQNLSMWRPNKIDWFCLYCSYQSLQCITVVWMLICRSGDTWQASSRDKARLKIVGKVIHEQTPRCTHMGK